MLKFLLPLALAVALPLSSCQSGEQATTEPTPIATATPAPTPEVDYYQQGLEQGKAAAAAAGMAKDEASWQGVVDGWNQAIVTFGKVPADHPNYAQAQEKVKSYQAAMGVAVDKKSKKAKKAKKAKFDKSAQAPKAAVSTPAPAPTMSDADLLREAISLAGPKGALANDVAIRGDIATFTMTFAYLSMNDDEKLEIAKSLQHVWAVLHSPENLDMGHINVEGPSGITIAKSDWLGATMVKLVD